MTETVARTESMAEAALELARMTGDVALKFFQSDRPNCVETKLDGTPVSRANREAEQVAIEWIKGRFPADGVVSEEFGSVCPECKRRWIVDPIDGTKTFLRGVPLWGTLVALMEATEVMAAAAYFPALDERLSAERGQGMWWNGTRCRVSDVSRISDSTVLATDPRFAAHPERRERWDVVSREAALARTWGDCYGYFLVATGRAEAMVDDVASLWDVAAMLLIVEEAGGVFTDWRGRRTVFGGDAIATNAAMAKEIRTRLGVHA